MMHVCGNFRPALAEPIGVHDEGPFLDGRGLREGASDADGLSRGGCGGLGLAVRPRGRLEGMGARGAPAQYSEGSRTVVA
jgi:hypothetical protein